jgi:hypothetical protein
MTRRALSVMSIASLGILVATGCSGGSTPGSSSGSGTSSASTTATGSSSTGATATSAVSSSPNATGGATVSTRSPTPNGPALPGVTYTAKPPAGEPPAIVLQSDGLGVLTRGAAMRQIPFAASQATAVKTAVATALGPVTVAQLPECGQGRRSAVTRAGFSALLDGTRFVGWSDQGAPGRRLSTAMGVGVGTTLASLRTSLGTVRVTTGSLGAEWSAAGYTGTLDGTQPSSKVTLIAAGETCFFR